MDRKPVVSTQSESRAQTVDDLVFKVQYATRMIVDAATRMASVEAELIESSSHRDQALEALARMAKGGGMSVEEMRLYEEDMKRWPFRG